MSYVIIISGQLIFAVKIDRLQIIELISKIPLNLKNIIRFANYKNTTNLLNYQTKQKK